MARLDIVYLRSLIAVASLASVRRAADALHLSQGAVSGHLRRLEAELGYPIVFRQGRSIAFTARGEDLLREAYELVEAHDNALDRLTAAPDDSLVIASTEHASEQLLDGVAKVLRAQFPTRPIRFEFHRTARLRELLHQRTAAVAIGFGDLGSGVEYVEAIPLSWVGPLSWVESTPTDTIADHLVVFARPCAIRERVLEAITDQPVVVRECIDMTSLLAAVRSGAGVTALPTRTELGPGLYRLDGLPSLVPVPLTFATDPRIDDSVRSQIRTELQQAWIAA